MTTVEPINSLNSFNYTLALIKPLGNLKPRLEASRYIDWTFYYINTLITSLHGLILY